MHSDNYKSSSPLDAFTDYGAPCVAIRFDVMRKKKGAPRDGQTRKTRDGLERRKRSNPSSYFEIYKKGIFARIKRFGTKRRKGPTIYALRLENDTRKGSGDDEIRPMRFKDLMKYS